MYEAPRNTNATATHSISIFSSSSSSNGERVEGEVEVEERKCVHVVAPLIPPMQTSRRKWNYPNKTSLIPLRLVLLFMKPTCARARARSPVDQSCKPNIAQCQCFVYRRSGNASWIRHKLRTYRTRQLRALLVTLETSLSIFFFPYEHAADVECMYVPCPVAFFSLSLPPSPLSLSFSLILTLAVTVPRDIPPSRKVPPGRSFSWRNRCNRYEKPNSQMAKIKLSDSWQSQGTTLLHGDKFEARILTRGRATWIALI